MDEAGIKESRVICEDSQGFEIRGTIIQLGRNQIAFEVYSPAAVIQTSEVLRGVKIELRGEAVYSGRAIVESVLAAELKVVCVAALDDDGWQWTLTKAELQPGRMRQLFKEHLREWQKLYLIRPEYKLQIADMESFFAELRTWLTQVELGVRGAPGNGRPVEDEVAQELGGAVLPAVDALFQKFEGIAAAVEPAARPVHRTYMQRRLHPLILCAPFVHRTFTKPLGYAGDYEMVNMIARDRPEGTSLFAKVVNLVFVRQPPAAAHRNRLKYLTQRLVQETARVASAGRTARIFSLACGPAVELQDFLREHELSDRAEFTLLDFNEETIDHVTTTFTQLKSKLGRRTPVRFIKRSVHQLLRDSVRTATRLPAEQYDFVYCAGLFDYLTDPVCQRLMTLLYDWVAPGGLLLATNVEPSNPVRAGTEMLLDWHLICRKGNDLQSLRPSQVAREDFLIQSDMTGVNLFMEARRPKDG